MRVQVQVLICAPNIYICFVCDTVLLKDDSSFQATVRCV